MGLFELRGYAKSAWLRGSACQLCQGRWCRQQPGRNLAGVPWARIGEQVGHDDHHGQPRHVVADERELDYQRLLRSALSEVSLYR
jgi:hypothetical protein